MGNSVFEGVYAISRSRYTYDVSSANAYFSRICPHCGAAQFAMIAYLEGYGVFWGRCTGCLKGVVVNDGAMSPSALPLRTPAGLPEVEGRVWAEVRRCLGVQANAAAVMLCRKLLFHVAVTHGLAAKNEKGWAPSFKECTDHLLSEGLITARMKPWVDRIKDVGNDANHEIVPITERQALDVATFTQKLLELAFEMDDAMSATGPDAEPPALLDSSETPAT